MSAVVREAAVLQRTEYHFETPTRAESVAVVEGGRRVEILPEELTVAIWPDGVLWARVHGRVVRRDGQVSNRRRGIAFRGHQAWQTGHDLASAPQWVRDVVEQVTR